MKISAADARALGMALAAIAFATVAYGWWLQVSNATTVALTYLLIILMTAATAHLLVATIASVGAVLCLNFFFLPPVGTLNVADPQNWVALFAFLMVSLVASRLSDRARSRAREASGRRDELARLFDLSRDVLGMTSSAEALSSLARSIARRFDLDLVAIALPSGADWQIVQAGGKPIVLDPQRLTASFVEAKASLDFDAYERTYAGHRSLIVDGRDVRLVPLRAGTKPIGLLAAAGRPVEAGTLDTLAGVVAIAIERTQFLEERKSAELTRQSEELKTALLAALGHDLRTPLTAIRLAASNLTGTALSDAERAEQRDVIVAEVARLTRLFDNVLQMARIDAGAVKTELRWTHPSEIIAAARDQVERGLRSHVVAVAITPDIPVQVDPRLTAMAVAHLLENAAQYSPPGARIDVTAGTTAEGLRIAVRDHGPGVQPKDLAHVFERFYRGEAGEARPTGSGMGLWIARGLLAAQDGRIWVENREGGGAQFTILVPTATVSAEDAAVRDDTTSPHPVG